MEPLSVDLADDAGRYLATDQLVWFQERPSAPVEQLVASVPADQRFAVHLEDGDPATYAAIYGVRPMTLSIPGDAAPRQVPVAGLTWVGVHPDHRRRGLLTAMLRDHFARCHDAGVALSALHASEPAIYGRHGYGMASAELQVTLGRGTALTAPALESEAASVTTTVRTLAEPGAAELTMALERRSASAELGAIVGELPFYAILAADFPEQQRGREPRRLLLATQDGERVGYAVFHRTERWNRERPEGKVVVQRLSGTPAVRLALLRRLLDLDLTATTEVHGVAADDELLAWLGGPRGAVAVESYDSLWIRPVDLPAALAMRHYAAPVDVVLEVTDAAAPWNAGRWRLVVDGTGAAEVTPTTADPDLCLPVEALGAAYLGASSLVTRQRAGLLEEIRPGATAALWRSLRSDLSPVAAIGF